MYQIVAVRESGHRIPTFLSDNLTEIAKWILNWPFAADGWYEIFEVDWQELKWTAKGPALTLGTCHCCGFLEEPGEWWAYDIYNYQYKCNWCDQGYEHLWLENKFGARVCSS